MSTKVDKTGGPAFPGKVQVSEEVEYSERYGCNITVPVYEEQSGMTLRDWFAGQALAGANFAMWTVEGDGGLAANCYRVADAMIAEREKEASHGSL